MNVTTLEPLQSRLAAIPQQPLRCIGSIPTAGGWRDYPISWSDAERDRDWAMAYLAGAGIAQGDFVCIVSSGHEAPWYQALLDATVAIGATICPLEPARFELVRAQMFFNRFPISSVIGLDLQLASALDEVAGLAEFLSDVRLLLVRPDAWQFARARGLSARLIAAVGPALGLGCGEQPLVAIDESEWSIREDSGDIGVVARKNRAIGIEPTPIDGAVFSLQGDDPAQLSVRLPTPD